ncbi:MAG: hypothetical protein KA735_05330 [Burkholderiaceae bacterium]|nr:hypothetical protein [Burkholderiaceae bacterium]
MPLSGSGMLITLMNVLPEEEQDFNEWYDKEHLAERVEIPGFMEARRYEAVAATPKYLNLYTTKTFDVLDSPVYHGVLQNQTERSRHHIPKFLDGIRAIARVTVSLGQGRGSVLTILHLRPGPVEARQQALRDRLLPALQDQVKAGLISAHLVEGDPELSKPLMKDGEVAPAVADWFVILDASSLVQAQCGLDALIGSDGLIDPLDIVSTGSYRLLWDLSRNEL